MATAQPMPASVNDGPNLSGAHSANEEGAIHALVASQPQTVEPDELAPLSAPVTLLPVELDVAVPVRQFRVRNLLALQPGQLIESQWGNGEDLPLASADVQLAWSEFEVIETQLAVRITRLA